MTLVRRIDAVTLLRRDAAEVSREGFRLYDALFARTGIQEYADGRGGVVREYRPDSEVFSEASLASYELRPLTDGHPPANVSTATARTLARGAISNARKHTDGIHVIGRLAVWDEELIRKFDSGQVDLSMGYEVEIERTPGVTADGHYHAIQRGPVMNHCAGVVEGRAGTARILDGADLVGAIDLGIAQRLDSIRSTSRVVYDMGRWTRHDANDLRTQTHPTAKDTKMKTIKITVDGKPVEIEVADNATPEQIAEAVAKPHADALEAAKKAADALPPEFLAKKKKKKGEEEEEEDEKVKKDALDVEARIAKAVADARAEAHADYKEYADVLSVARSVFGLGYTADSVATMRVDTIERVLGKDEREAISRLPKADQAGATSYAFQRAARTHAAASEGAHTDGLMEAIRKARPEPKADGTPVEDSITKARREAADAARNPQSQKAS